MPFRFALAALAVFAFAPQPKIQQDSNASRMVLLNVAAVDNHGKAIENLTEDNLRVTDNGKPQSIVFFEHNESTSRLTPDVAPGTFSNRRGIGSPDATVILFDLLNEAFATRGAAASDLSRALQPLNDADNLYLYLLTVDGRLYAVHGLPKDGKQTLPPQSTPWTRDIKSLLDSALNTVSRVRPMDIDIAIREPMTYGALNNLGTQLAAVPGRKNIVWITDGIPIRLGPVESDTGDFVDFMPQLRQLSEQFERYRVALYPVRQIMIGEAGAVDGSISGMGLGGADTLDEFAAMTGGRPDQGRDIGSAVRQAMQDLRESYRIGYVPSPSNWDGKLHKIHLESDLKGVRLESKTEYFAGLQAAGPDLKATVDSLLYGPDDHSEIGLSATLSRDPRDAKRATLQLNIDANDIILSRRQGQYAGDFQVVLVRYLSGGKILDSAPHPLHVQYGVRERDQALAEGIRFSQSVALDDNLEQLRIIVYDSQSALSGSLTIPRSVFAKRGPE